MPRQIAERRRAASRLILKGADLRRYFLQVLAADPAISRPASVRLATRFVRDVVELRLRVAVPLHRKPEQPVVVQEVPPLAAVKATKPEPTVAAAFDPYVFSVVALMMKSGREAVAKKLADIGELQNLRALAEAQHLALPAGLTASAEVEKAVLAAAERRIAERRGAASR